MNKLFSLQQWIHGREDVTYWPSTVPSIKRCTCVNKWKNSETGAPGRRYWNITLTSGRGWIRYAYAHWKQVDGRQLYNQVPQTAWGSQSVSQFEFQFHFQLQLESVRNKMSAWEPTADRGLWALSNPRLSSPAKMRKKCCYDHEKNFGSICSGLSLSPTHLSHTRNINPFENKVLEVYFYEEVCSFVHWSRHYCWQCFRIYIYIYIYCVVVCGYTTQTRFFNFCMAASPGERKLWIQTR